MYSSFYQVDTEKSMNSENIKIRKYIKYNNTNRSNVSKNSEVLRIINPKDFTKFG